MTSRTESSGFITKVEIREQGDEYLLFVPIALKERAKAIEGRRWDPERRCWVYNRTKRNYDALIAEFADEAVTVDISLPPRPVGLPQASPQARDEVGQAVSVGPQPAIALAQERELLALRVALEAERRRSETLEKRVDELSRQFEEDKSRAVRAAGPAWLRQVVTAANAGDETFAQIAGGLRVDERAPVEVTKHLESKLATLLGFTSQAPRPSLNELIAQARDAQIISAEAYHLAQMIRTHRNMLMHQKTDRRTRMARVVLVISAAALLWPHLPE